MTQSLCTRVSWSFNILLKLAFIKLNHSPLAVISTFNILLKSTHKKIRVFYNPIKDTYSFQYSIEINILRRLRDNGWKLDAIFQYSIEINFRMDWKAGLTANAAFNILLKSTWCSQPSTCWLSKGNTFNILLKSTEKITPAVRWSRNRYFQYSIEINIHMQRGSVRHRV